MDHSRAWVSYFHHEWDYLIDAYEYKILVLFRHGFNLLIPPPPFHRKKEKKKGKIYKLGCHWINVDSTNLYCCEQVSIVSVVYSQSDLLKKEVFLVELIDSISKSKESMSHLKAVYFLRPTPENIQRLRRQLANPRFGEYHLCKLQYLFLICFCF